MRRRLWIFTALLMLVFGASIVVSDAPWHIHVTWLLTWCSPMIVAGALFWSSFGRVQKIVLIASVWITGAAIWLLAVTSQGGKFEPNVVSYLVIIASWLLAGSVMVAATLLLERIILGTLGGRSRR
ncbi:MAG: hypothetical protein AAGD38_19175 [Acidobacteriota bacterium]